MEKAAGAQKKLHPKERNACLISNAPKANNNTSKIVSEHEIENMNGIVFHLEDAVSSFWKTPFGS